MNKNIVVLYKKTGKAPVIKVITNMFEIKKMIVQGNLDMVKFENYVIVCNSKKKTKNALPNIVLDFKHIAGDFFLIGYDIKRKDFRSLTTDEVKFYKGILNSKSFKYDIYKKWQKKCNLRNDKKRNNVKQYRETYKNLAENSNREIGESEEKSCLFSPTNEQMLEMILNIQAVIFKFIRNMNGNNN